MSTGNASPYLRRSISSLLGLMAIAAAASASAQSCDYVQTGYSEQCATGSASVGSVCYVGAGESACSDPGDSNQSTYCWVEPVYECVEPAPDYFDAVGGGEGGGGSDSSEVAAIVEQKEETCDKGVAVTAHPVVVTSGQKLLNEVDFVVGNENPLPIVRMYSSFSGRPGVFGPKWRAGFEYSMELVYPDGECAGSLTGAAACASEPQVPVNIVLYREGAPVVLAKDASGDWVDPKADYLLQSVQDGWRLMTKDGGAETYSAGLQPLEVLDAKGAGWRYSYSPAGKATTITHTSGRSVSLTWNTENRIASITAPGNKTYGYSYGAFGGLAAVVYPGNLGRRDYHYEDVSLPWAVTGISVNGVRHTRYGYYPDGRVSESGLETGIDTSSFVYDEAYTDVTNSNGHTVHYTLAPIDGGKRIVRVDRPATVACPSGIATTEFGADNEVASETDSLGNKSEYEHDAFGRVTSVTRGIGPNDDRSRQQITLLSWDAAGMVLLQKKEYGSTLSSLLRETTYSYYPSTDASGRANLLQSVTVFDRSSPLVPSPSRVTSHDYTFHANHQIATITTDGPALGAADKAIRQFNSNGDLLAVTDALNLTTSYSLFDSAGRPGRMTDANGLASDIFYDDKGRVVRVVTNAPGGPRQIDYRYNGFDQIVGVTDATGHELTYGYDQAMRLLSISTPSTYPSGMGESTDSVGYSYDANSRVTAQQVKQDYQVLQFRNVGGEIIEFEQPRVTTYRSSSYTYDAAGRLQAEKGNNGQNIRYTYDANGGIATVTDSGGHVSSFGYDSHRRLASARDHSYPNSYVKLYYDALGRLVQVTDQRGLLTKYRYNGYDELVRVESPDSGVTTYTYDEAGRLTALVRPDGATISNTVDLLGRVIRQEATWQAPNQANPALVQVFTFDNCTNGKGRLCRVDDDTGSTSFAYLGSGELASQSTTIQGVSGLTQQYSYDAFGRLLQVTYPNGNALRYGYNSASQVVRIEALVAGVWKDVVKSAVYQPFGGVTSWIYGNGLSRTHALDLDGRITAILGSADSPQSMTLQYNSDDLITGVTNSKAPSLSQTYGYNGTHQLTSANTTGAAGNQSYAYDKTGNRTSHTWGGQSRVVGVSTTSNRLTSIGGATPRAYSYSAAGLPQQITMSGVATTLQYNGLGRAVSVSRPQAQAIAMPTGNTVTLPAGTWKYGYNAFGQRAYKWDSTSLVTRRYMYDPSGILVAESNQASGQLDSVYISLNGMPVGLIRNNQLYFIHPDHLGRPEVVTSSTKATVWRAENYAFDRRVSVDSLAGLNIGFPGQYYDAESANWYNYFRTYDGATGKYLQPDPIGIAGGVNLYAYVGSNPITFVDPRGLEDSNAVLYGAGVINQLPQRNSGRLPDYLKISVNYYVINGSLSYGRNGRLYAAGGVSRNYPHSVAASASASAGWLNCAEKPSSSRLESFLTGPGVSTVGAYNVIGGGVTYSPGLGTSSEVGMGVGINATDFQSSGGPALDHGWFTGWHGPDWGW